MDKTDKYELLKVIEKNIKKMDVVEERLENDLKKGIMEKHIYRSLGEDDKEEQVIVPISGKTKEIVRKKILKRMKEGSIDMYKNIIEWNNKNYFVGEFFNSKNQLKDILNEEDIDDEQKKLNRIRNEFTINIRKIISEGGYKYLNKSGDKIMKSIMETSTKYVNPIFYLLIHRLWDDIISKNLNLSFTEDYGIEYIEGTEDEISSILNELYSMFRKSFNSEIILDSKLFGSSFNRQDKIKLVNRITDTSIMDEVMPWVFLPDVVFRDYEEYDLLARLFRVGEMSIDKVFTERVLLKKDVSGEVINYPLYVGGVDNKIRYYFGELSRLYLELNLIEQSHQKYNTMDDDTNEYYDSICCMKVYVEMLMLIMQLFYIIHVYHWIINLKSDSNMKNIIEKISQEYETEKKRLVILSNKLGLILEGGVPENDIEEFMDLLVMDKDKKNKLKDVIDIVKQEGGTKLLDEMGDAVKKTRYDILRNSKEEIDKNVESIDNMINLLSNIKGDKLSSSYIFGFHKNEITSLFESMWGSYLEQEVWFRNSLNSLVEKGINYESLAGVFNNVEDQTRLINQLRSVEMSNIEDLLDAEYEDSEKDIVEEFHRKLKKMEDRRNKDFMDEKLIDLDENEADEEEENENNNIMNKIDKIRIVFDLEETLKTGGSRLNVGDLTAELVDKKNPNLLLSFIADTEIMREAGIFSSNSFLDGKFERGISLYSKGNFRYGFKNEERLYINLLNQVGYQEDLARLISVGYKYFNDSYLFNILRRYDHQVFGGVYYGSNSGVNKDWYALYVESKIRGYGENKLGKITMMVRDEIFNTFLGYKRSFRDTTLIGLNERDVVPEDENNVRNQIHYLKERYFVPKLHTRRGAAASREFKYDNSLGVKNVVNDYVNKLGRRWNIKDRLKEIFSSDVNSENGKYMLDKLSKLLVDDKPEILLKEITEEQAIDVALRLCFSMLVDVDEDSSTRVLSLDNLGDKVKKIFGNGYLFLNKLPSNRISSNTNGKSVVIDFDNVIMTYKNNTLQVRKVKCMNMNALNSWQKITWNSLINTDIEEAGIDSTWFQVSQPVSYSLDYLVEVASSKSSIHELYYDLKLMNNIQKYNLVTIYDVTLNVLTETVDGEIIKIGHIFKDRLLENESIDYILDILRRELFKEKNDETQELCLHKIRKSVDSDEIILSVSIWSTDSGLNPDLVVKKINDLDMNKIQLELKSFFFSTDTSENLTGKVRNILKYGIRGFNKKLIDKEINEELKNEGNLIEESESDIYKSIKFSIDINDNKFGKLGSESNRYKAIRCWIYKKIRKIYKSLYELIQQDSSNLHFMNYMFKFNEESLKSLSIFFTKENENSREFPTINEYFEEIQNSFYLADDYPELDKEDDKIDISLLFDVVLGDDVFIKDLNEPLIEKVNLGNLNKVTRDSHNFASYRRYSLVNYIKKCVNLVNKKDINDDSVGIMGMKDMYDKYILKSRTFKNEYDDLQHVALSKKSNYTFVRDMLQEIVLRMIDSKELSSKHLEGIYMWFKDAINGQNIIEPNEEKMKEKQKRLEFLLEQVIKEDLTKILDSDLGVEKKSISNKYMNVKNWMKSLIYTFIFLRGIGKSVIVDKVKKGTIDKFMNIRNFKNIKNKELKNIEFYTTEMFGNLYKLVDIEELPDGKYFIPKMRDRLKENYTKEVIDSKEKKLRGNYVYEDDLLFGTNKEPNEIYLADSPEWYQTTNKRKNKEDLKIYGGGKEESQKLSEKMIRSIYAELLDNFDKNMIKYLISSKEYKYYLSGGIEKIIPNYKEEHKSYCSGKFWYYNSINPIDGIPMSKKSKF